MSESTGSQEELTKEDRRDAGLVRRWLVEIKMAERHFEKWRKKAKKVIDVYTDQGSDDDYGQPKSEFNILWSNVQTQKPALYSRTPIPEVQRRHKDRDRIGRAAAQALERALKYSVKAYDFDSVICQSRDDLLLVGRGAAWVRYLPTFTTAMGEDGQPVIDEATGEPVQEVETEEVKCEYVNWRDFLHSPARNWNEVRWVARRSYLSKREVKERFRGVKLDEMAFDHMPENLKDDDSSRIEHDYFKRATIWEIWDKDDKQVYWISPGYKRGPLEQRPDPLGLKDFFPCPKPLYSTTTTDDLVPVPDFCLYQHLAEELDEITRRIYAILDQIRVRGAYDASIEGLSAMLDTGVDNAFFPIENWTTYSQSGGFEGSVNYFPIETPAAVLLQLYQAREQTKATIYEVTGMSDVMRGASNPNETATAQQIKGQFSTLRLSDRQKEVQRFCRDIIAIMGEIMAEHFDPQTFAAMTGIEFLGEQDPNAIQNYTQAIQLLKQEKLRSYRITIETDSTIAIDASIEKQNRIEFIQSASQFIERAMQASQMFPQGVPVFGELLLFALKAYPAGRNLETVIEQLIEQGKELQNQPQQPDPKQIEMQVRQQMKEQELQLKAQEAQVKAQIQQMEAQQKAFLKEQELQIRAVEAAKKHDLELERMRGQLALQAEKIMGDLSMKAANFQQQEITRTIKDLGRGVEIGPTRAKKAKATFSNDPITGERVAIIEAIPDELEVQ